MKHFELTNQQRKYFGLDSIESKWTPVILPGDIHRPSSILYFEGNIIKRQIISTADKYTECHFDEKTEKREILLPKTTKGKPKKLSASTLEQRRPNGVYLNISSEAGVMIASHTSETTFFDSKWARISPVESREISQVVADFISESPKQHLKEVAGFKLLKRRHQKFKPGDFFRFKIKRDTFGFGRVLMDIAKLRKTSILNKEHGLNLIMGPPLLVHLYIHEAKSKEIDLADLINMPKLPSDLMMDNLLLYGEYEVIGHKPLTEADFEFPISFGRSIDQRPVVFLQWGLIHLELPIRKFDKYLVAENPLLPENSPSKRNTNPYGYYAIGFRPRYDTQSILKAIKNGHSYAFEQDRHFRSIFDLRNPLNASIKEEIFNKFGLNPKKSYVENCITAKTRSMLEVLNN